MDGNHMRRTRAAANLSNGSYVYIYIYIFNIQTIDSWENGQVLTLGSDYLGKCANHEAAKNVDQKHQRSL